MTIKQLPLAVVVNETRRLREQTPLVHCLTNEVVQNITANALLAINASPAMVVAQQEVAQFTAVANNLLINVGTLYEERAASMLIAAETAHKTDKNWVLDPVAVGPLTYRTEFVQRLLQYKPRAIRGNASEILALAGQESLGKGADSADSTQTALPAAVELALRYQTIVAVTGETDYVTDGTTIWSLPWGHPIMTKVTGCGCALSAVVAAFIADAPDKLNAVAAACALVAIAGQQAQPLSQGSGSFTVHFIDQLYNSPNNLPTE